MTTKKFLKNQKGFTLIEIIVVLIIVAMLAAFAIPAMMTFVEQARGKAYISEARVGFVAAQAVITEVVASGGTVTPGTDNTKVTPKSGTETPVVEHATFKELVKEVSTSKSSDETGMFDKVTVDANNRVTGITYFTGKNKSSNYTVTISNGTTTVIKGVTGRPERW